MGQFKPGKHAQEAGRQGGRATQAKLKTPMLSPDQLGGPIDSPDACKARLALMTDAVLTGTLDPKAADVAIRAVRAWLEAHASSLTTTALDELRSDVARLQEQLRGRPSLGVS